LNDPSALVERNQQSKLELHQMTDQLGVNVRASEDDQSESSALYHWISTHAVQSKGRNVMSREAAQFQISIHILFYAT